SVISLIIGFVAMAMALMIQESLKQSSGVYSRFGVAIFIAFIASHALLIWYCLLGGYAVLT
ncbi:MAG TPA: hypothetical protein PLZ51_17300, partial [Aggregatilineales bacterium]|nr:hypothetical protein [Aggregatilineales bacterium]